MSLIETAISAVYPATVDEVKANSRIDYTDDDTLIGVLIGAATRAVEQHLNRDISERTYTYSFDEFETEFCIPAGPVLDVSSITYKDYTLSPITQTLDATVYELDLGFTPAVIRLAYDQAWPTPTTATNAITVTFRTGWIDTSTSPITDNTPEPVKQAIIMLASDMYENSESQITGRQVQENKVVSYLLEPYRVYA